MEYRSPQSKKKKKKSFGRRVVEGVAQGGGLKADVKSKSG